MNVIPTTDDASSNISERLKLVEKEIEALKQRNFEKDRGKEFESSYTRVIFIMVVTYWTLFGYMAIIKTNQPFLDAIVPTVGFNISTWSLPHVKVCWIKLQHWTMCRKVSCNTCLILSNYSFCGV